MSFKFLNRVTFKDGFYAGYLGTVIAHNSTGYEVRLDPVDLRIPIYCGVRVIPLDGVVITAWPDDLELVKDE